MLRQPSLRRPLQGLRQDPHSSRAKGLLLLLLGCRQPLSADQEQCLRDFHRCLLEDFRECHPLRVGRENS